MADQFDRELDDRLARLSAAVPIAPDDAARLAAGRTSPVGRAVWHSPLGMSAAPLVAIVAIVVAAGLLGGGRQGSSGATVGLGSGSALASESGRTPASPSDDDSAFPGACAGLGLTLNKCAGFAAWSIGEGGLEPGHIQRIEMTKVDCPGGIACPTETTGYMVNVHLVTDRGDPTDEVVSCLFRLGSLGGPISFLCDSMVNAATGQVIEFPLVHSAIAGGYHDTPCAGEAPENPCATPLPTIDPSALAASKPLEIGTLQIPIDHAGPYSVVLGQASLPNGILTAASAAVTSSPADPLVAYDGYRLVVTSLDGGPPFDNYYQHGWRPGPERVQVTLTFTVLMFEPGAVVEVSTIEVR